MDANYRIIFTDGPLGNKRECCDVYAQNIDEAFEKAYQMPEAKNRNFTDVLVEEIPKEPSVIGIKFEYYDTAFKETFSSYMFIRANNEAEAIEYYNKHFKGGRFLFNAGESVENGKCIRGKILNTYFAACPGYHADATFKEQITNSLSDKIESAKEKKVSSIPLKMNELVK